jgi:hypothetical protein
VAGTSAVAELALSRPGTSRGPAPRADRCRKAAAVPPSLPLHSPPRPRRAGGARRTLAALAAAGLAALAAVGVAAPVGAAPAPPTTSVPAEAAAGWLSRQLVDGSHFETGSGGATFPDAGLTLDAVLAFAAAGVAGDSAAAAMDWIGQPANLAGYVGDGTDESYVGGLAKLSFTAQVEGLDPTAFGAGEVDLLARLRALLTPSGRFSDKSQYGDFSNAFGQAYAILALDRAGGAPAPAVDFLAGSECPGGGFPLDFGKPTCTPDTDATAVVAQALAAAGAAAAGDAVDWLLDQQLPDGSFGGGTSTEAPNANSTGVAAQALAAAGETEAAGRAVAFLERLQSGCTAPAEQRGAVRYLPGAFDPATAPRATGQATLGLAGIGLGELDGTEQAAAAPVLACTPAPSPTTTAPPTTPPTSPPTEAPITAPTAPTTSPAAPPAPVPPPAYGGELPATGADPVPVALLGLALVGTGVVLAVVARRRRPSSP